MFPRSGITTVLLQTMSDLGDLGGIRNSKMAVDDKPEVLISRLVDKISISQVMDKM